MPRQLHFTAYIISSLVLHALLMTAALYIVKPALPEMPFVLPVKIVNLPQAESQKLPPLRQPAVPPVPAVPGRPVMEKTLPPSAVPLPKKFGSDETVKLPKTTARTGLPEGAEEGQEAGKAAAPPLTQKHAGPLPFLTQSDIDELARKGMPERKPGDDSVTLDTDEFKFISYNRWLKIKVESVLKYPELAAISGYQGTLFIKFDIMKDGSLGGLEVLKPSGYKILDDEALRAIRNSAPFQPLPDDWNMERYSIRAAVIFYLGEGYIR